MNGYKATFVIFLKKAMFVLIATRQLMCQLADRPWRLLMFRWITCLLVVVAFFIAPKTTARADDLAEKMAEIQRGLQQYLDLRRGVEDYTEKQTGLSFPARIGPFHRVWVTGFPDPRWGVGIRYTLPGVANMRQLTSALTRYRSGIDYTLPEIGRLDIFVYDNGCENIGTGTQSATVQLHYDLVKRAVAKTTGIQLGSMQLIVEGFGAQAIAPALSPIGALTQHLDALGVTESNGCSLWQYRAVTLVSEAEEAVKTPAGEHKLLHAYFTFRERGYFPVPPPDFGERESESNIDPLLHSHVYLTGYKGKFLKVRLTYIDAEKEKGDAARKQLLGQIGKWLK
jgi:hypothetical protein